MRNRRRLACFVLVLSALALGAPAGAAEPDAGATDARERAREHYARAAEAYDRGHYKQAIEELTKANQLSPSPALSYNIARAYERLGDDESALAYYRDFLRREPAATDAPGASKRVALLEAELQKKGVQQLTVLSTPERATVVLDDQPVGITPWNGVTKPGQHRVVLRLAGFADARRDVELPKDHALDVSFTLEPAETSVAPPPSAPASVPAPLPAPGPTPAPVPERRKVSVLTWASFGVGALALGGAFGFELGRRSAENDSKNAATQIDASADYDRMQSRQKTARVLAGVGAVAAAAGGVLLYLDLSRTRRNEVGVAFQCRGAGCALGAAGRF